MDNSLFTQHDHSVYDTRQFSLRGAVVLRTQQVPRHNGGTIRETENLR